MRKVMSKILSFLYKNEKYKEKVKRIIKAFAFCVSYQMRMEFLDFCEELLSDTEMYQEFLKEVLKVISCDRISHVKISLAKMISNIVDKKQNIMKKYLLYDEDFLKICFKVMNDNNIKLKQVHSNGRCYKAPKYLKKYVNVAMLVNLFVNSKTCEF